MAEYTQQFYQAMIAAHRYPDPKTGGERMTRLIARLSAGVPTVLVELVAPRQNAQAAYRGRVGLLRAARYKQRTHRDYQRTPRRPMWHHPQLLRHHQLHRPLCARSWRLATPTTPWIAVSPLTRCSSLGPPATTSAPVNYTGQPPEMVGATSKGPGCANAARRGTVHRVRLDANQRVRPAFMSVVLGP